MEKELKHKAIPTDEGKYILAWDKRCPYCKFPDAHKPTKELTYEELPYFSPSLT